MPRRVLRFREENRDIFELVRRGKKKIETRAATEKYRNMAEGDVAVFVCGGDRFTRKIKSVELFKTVAALLKAHRIKEINPGVRTAKALIDIYNSFPGYKEKIKKFGLVAIEV